MAKTYDSHYRAKQEQQLEDHAALLRDEVFNVVPVTVNMQCGTALKSRKVRSGSDYSNDEVFHLSQVLDMPIAGSSHGQKVTFRSPVVRLGQCHVHPIWSLSQCPLMCCKFPIVKHLGRTQIVRLKQGQGLHIKNEKDEGRCIHSSTQPSAHG